MTLYFEDDPADESTPPQLPPLLRAVEVPVGQDVLAKAIAVAPSTEIGTVFYSQDADSMKIAVRLAPEVPLKLAGQMLFTMMVGLGDAIGALAPPEIAVTYQLPGYLLLNRGRAGLVRLVPDPAASRDEVPEWMIVGAEVRLSQLSLPEGEWTIRDGEEHTSLAEEGGGFISRTRLVESSCRHFLVWVNRWTNDGFKPIYDAWMQRLDGKTPILFEDGSNVDWLGLDEDGGALLKVDGKPTSILPHHLEDFCGSPRLKWPS
jgi:BirA family biotin operon repressor/biotin-[acetyl-CoA-carboxylase] ligase